MRRRVWRWLWRLWRGWELQEIGGHRVYVVARPMSEQRYLRMRDYVRRQYGAEQRLSVCGVKGKRSR